MRTADEAMPVRLPIIVVADVTCQEEPERLSDLFCAWRVEPTEIPFVFDAVR